MSVSGHDRDDDNDPALDIDGNEIPGMTKGVMRQIDRDSHLYHHLQTLKKQLRLQLVDDLVRMKTSGAPDDELLERIQEHHHTRRVMRDLYNIATDNEMAWGPPLPHSYYRLMNWCDGAGVPLEYKEHCERKWEQSTLTM